MKNAVMNFRLELEQSAVVMLVDQMMLVEQMMLVVTIFMIKTFEIQNKSCQIVIFYQCG
jgi:hypothetical protein